MLGFNLCHDILSGNHVLNEGSIKEAIEEANKELNED